MDRSTLREALAGRVAVVTGASSGIGLATAVALATAGARVALVSRSAARLEAAAREVDRAARNRAAALRLPCDVSDPDAVVAMAERVRRDAGTPDIVVNNAGIGHWGPIVELPLERIRTVFDVNFFGAVHCTKAFLPAMLARRRGTVVFVSSGFGELPFPRTAAYCASKHAMNGFAGSLRAEVEPLGINVLLVLPGVTRTAFFDANAYPADVLSRHLFQQMVSPERVARRIVRALNELGLRLCGAAPELLDAFLARVGRRVLREPPDPATPRDLD
jgi:short-subunit dehydrogenase